MIILLL
jgi:hypothetical protein